LQSANFSIEGFEADPMITWPQHELKPPSSLPVEAELNIRKSNFRRTV
jgi:hypothetical protein